MGTLIKIADDTIVEEPTGTRIIIPIKSADINLFKKYAQQTTFFWKEPVVFHGASNVESFNFADILYKKSDWILVPDFQVPYDSVTFVNPYFKLLAVIDGIQYEIKLDLIKKLPDICNNEGFFNTLFSNRVILVFNTGEINISANREELYYDDKTINRIVERLMTLKKELFEVLAEVLNTKKDYYSLVLAWNDFNRRYISFPNSVTESFLSRFIWNGKNVNILREISADNPMTIRCYTTDSKGDRRSSSCTNLHFSSRSIVYENDDGTTFPSRSKVESLIAQHQKTEFFIISYDHSAFLKKMAKRTEEEKTLLNTAEPTYEQAIAKSRELNNLDLFNFPKLSSIEKKKNFKVTHIKRDKALPCIRPVKTITFDKHLYYLNATATNIDINAETGYYVINDGGRYKLENDNEQCDNSMLRNIFSYHKQDFKLYSISQKYIDLAKKSSKGLKLLGLDGHVRSLMLSDRHNIPKYFAVKNNKHFHNYKTRIGTLARERLISTIFADEMIKDFINLITLNSPLFMLDSGYDKIRKDLILEYQQQIKEESEKVTSLIDYINDTYPILGHLSVDDSRKIQATEAVVKYLNSFKTSCISARA
jgi:hypothetical protein